MLTKVQIPESIRGEWRIERFTTDPVRCMAYAGEGRNVPANEQFTRLMRGRTVVMSDTPAEMADCHEPVRMARGSCLVNGLGLGLVLKAILDKPEVTDVTVVEISREVFGMVSPYYTDPRITFVLADAMAYKPPVGKRYQMVWHDIWDYISADNLPQMHKLHRKYGRRADWQGSWCRRQCELSRGRHI